MNGVRTPIHEDAALDDEWFATRRITVGRDVYRNYVRDGSGRYSGYIAVVNGEPHTMATVQEAEQFVLKLTGRNV